MAEPLNLGSFNRNCRIINFATRAESIFFAKQKSALLCKTETNICFGNRGGREIQKGIRRTGSKVGGWASVLSAHSVFPKSLISTPSRARPLGDRPSPRRCLPFGRVSLLHFRKILITSQKSTTPSLPKSKQIFVSKIERRIPRAGLILNFAS